MHWLPGLTLDLPGTPRWCLTLVTITRPDPELQTDVPAQPWPSLSPQTGLAIRTLG